MHLWFHDFISNLQKKYSHHSEKKNNENKNNKKNLFNKSERSCRDVKTQKACKQSWKANIGPKIKQTTST